MKTLIKTSNILLFGLLCLIIASSKLSGTSIKEGSFQDPADNSDPVKIDTLAFDIMDPATGVRYYKDDIIILSNSKYQQKMISDHISFGQNGTYLLDPDDQGSSSSRMFISGNPFPASPDGMALSSDFSQLYFTAPEEGARAGSPEKIFSVALDDSRSSNQAFFDKSDITVLPFCDDNARYMHPAISGDNSFIIFASDNSESIGGSDLFIARKKGNSWANPVNLGNSINSKKNEIYPFLDRENNLYFSSEGHAGFGGYDIYMCQFIEDGWGKPVNLMKSVNGPDDEVAITIDQENRTGYFSVINRPGEQSKQLFKIYISESGKLSDALLVQAQTEFKKLYDEELTLAVAPVVSQSKVAQADQEKPEDKPVQASSQTTAGGSTGAAAVAAGTTAAVVTAAATEKEPEKVEEKPVVKEPVETPVTVVAAVDDSETVFFRIQITSSSTPKSNYRVTIDGKSYPTFEYLYKGAYRYTVGNFRTVSEAKAFQTKCRNAGFSQAFVAAFINDVRETDPAVFKQ